MRSISALDERVLRGVVSRRNEDALGLEVLIHGLDALLGTHGNPLSAGQRQRLGLARAFLRFPDVLILDEATSALDSVMEDLVLRNARELMHDGCLVLITHRENVAASLDRVVRIENGRVREASRLPSPLPAAAG